MCKVIKVKSTHKQKRYTTTYSAAPGDGAHVPQGTKKARLHQDTRRTRQAFTSVDRPADVPPREERCLIPEAQRRWGNKYIH